MSKMNIRRALRKIDQFLLLWNKIVKRWFWWQRCDKDIDRLTKRPSLVLDLHHPSVSAAKNYWKKYHIKLNPKWPLFFARLNNTYSSRYIPEDILFSYIIPSLNNNDLYKAYTDKNSYDVFMRGIKMPKTLLRCIHGNLHNECYALLTKENYTDSFSPEEIEGFIKPAIDSGQGKNIKKCTIRKGKIVIDDIAQGIDDLISFYEGEFIIQKSIDQSLILSEIYPYSVNSIRPVSLRHNGAIVVLSYLVLFGGNKNYVSNIAAGGVVCGIDEHGKLTEFAYDKKFNKIFRHPFTCKLFKNITLPNFSKLEKMIIQCHERLPHFDFVAWDFGLDNTDDYTLIEYNTLLPGLHTHQVFNGPILEKYLDDILSKL